MALYKQDDLLEVLLALEERIMRKLQVASLAKVMSIDKIKNECSVKLIPNDEDLEAFDITCKYSQSVSEVIEVNSIVIILFLNKDSRQQLNLLNENINTEEILQLKNTHNEVNGVVIDVFRKKEIE